MKRFFLIGLILALCAIPGLSFSQNATSKSGATAGAIANPVASVNLTQTSTVPEGAGRWYLPPVGLYSPPVYPYIGPFNSTANIIDDLRVFPPVLTREQAKRMYKGGVDIRINPFEEFNYKFDECKLLHAIPVKRLVATDGKDVVDEKGNVIYIPDESKFKRVAIITLDAEPEAGTADVIPRAATACMDLGATAIVLIKKAVQNGSKSSGWGFGTSSSAAQIGGQGQTNAITGSGGTGYNSAKAKPTYQETMSVLAIQEGPWEKK